jgi:hypothetical protein
MIYATFNLDGLFLYVYLPELSVCLPVLLCFLHDSVPLDLV